MPGKYPIQPNELTPERRRRTATHEAGHAVVAWLLGIRFEYVTIEPRDDSSPDKTSDSGDLGHVRRRVRFGEYDRIRRWEAGDSFDLTVDTNSEDVVPCAGLWPDYREQMEGEILYCLAGYAAEWIHYDRGAEDVDEYEVLEEQESDGGDGTKAAGIARTLTLDEWEADAYISLLRCRVRNLLDLPGSRRAVQLLAAELVAEGEAEEDVAVAIMREGFNQAAAEQ